MPLVGVLTPTEPTDLAVWSSELYNTLNYTYTYSNGLLDNILHYSWISTGK